MRQKKKYNKLFIRRHITSFRNTQCSSNSNNYIHKINTERITKEKQHHVYRSQRAKSLSTHRGRTHTKQSEFKRNMIRYLSFVSSTTTSNVCSVVPS